VDFHDNKSFHIPVFKEEIKYFANKFKFSTVTDCTFGAGGHSRIFNDHGAQIIAIDRDPIAENFIFDTVQFFNDKFSHIDKYVTKCDLIFADLGVSSMQLDSNRGFSFMEDSELDMRMDDNGDKLKTLLNKMPVYKIREILQNYGEEAMANKISHNIDRYRLKTEITSTKKLREAIGIDKFPVIARVFQAFRIFINQELEELEVLLSKIPHISDNAFIITFHSIEDRLVKLAFRKFYKYHTFLKPTKEEIADNPKSRSAKLRIGSNVYQFENLTI
jgi:16S rRNA (cytosine1402-N4)-methyltransferase